MDESFSPTIFLYGMALVLAVEKAFTLTICRTLPKPRPGLKQEMLQAWRNRRLRKQAATSPVQHRRSEQAVDEPSKNAEAAKREPHAIVPASEQDSATQPGSNPTPEK
jgi:predicted lipid-binding transport protein (Tim44 family)